MKARIIDIMREVALNVGVELQDRLDDDTVLLESGLDSLGFATLVAELEERLGYDPFSLMDEPIYPRTLGAFCALYERYAPCAAST